MRWCRDTCLLMARTIAIKYEQTMHWCLVYDESSCLGHFQKSGDKTQTLSLGRQISKQALGIILKFAPHNAN